MSSKVVYFILMGMSCLVSSTASAQAPAAVEADKTSPISIKKRPGIIERSTLLASGGNWTMIPKTAAIYVPDRYKNKIVSKPTGTVLSWADFKKKNSGWIHTHEVNANQARGKEVIDQKIIKAYQSMGKIVVATYNKGPISVQEAALLPPEIKEK
ncbi:MAG: hypothetical protein ACSHXL_03550 [Bacteroidota bacterium]